MRLAITTMFAAVLLMPAPARSAPASESGADDVLRVDVSLSPPFVMQKEDGEFYGYDIELVRTLADDLGKKAEFRLVPFTMIFDGVENGMADLAAAGITITASREARVDFSHHYFDSGLAILVPAEKIKAPPWYEGFVIMMKSPIVWGSLFTVLIFTFILANLVWLTALRSDKDFRDFYPVGIFQAMWYVIVTMTTVGYGDKVPDRWIGKSLAVVIMIAGIVVFADLTGKIASAYTTEAMNDVYSGPADLRGKTVAVKAGTTSEEIMHRFGASVRPEPAIEEAFAALETKKADAVVTDAPVARYHALRAGAGKAALTGRVFDRQYYGIAMPEASPLREELNRALLKARQNGVQDAIHTRWFGSGQ